MISINDFKALIVATTDINADDNALPRRHMVALRGLSIFITPSDKGSSVVVMDFTDYNNKIMELLNDKDTNKFFWKPYIKI